MCGLRCEGGAVKIRASAGSVRIRIALMALAQISPSHWLRVVGLLVPLTVVSAGWDQTVARSPRNDPPKRVIHGPNYRPPYAAIVVDDKSEEAEKNPHGSRKGNGQGDGIGRHDRRPIGQG